MTSEERLSRLERSMSESDARLTRTERLVEENAEQIASLHIAVAKTNESVWRTHRDVVKLEVKIDQLSSVIAHLVGKDPLDFGRRVPEDEHELRQAMSP